MEKCHFINRVWDIQLRIYLPSGQLFTIYAKNEKKNAKAHISRKQKPNIQW